MANIPIGIQLYTVRDQLAKEPKETLKAVADIGYAGVEGGPPGGMDAQAFLETLDDLGMTLIGGGCSSAELRENIEGVAERSKALGVTRLMTGVGGELRRLNNDWKRVTELLAEGCANAAEAGLEILYHNHAFELEGKVAVNGGETTGLDYMLENIPAEHMGAELDTYWIQTGGYDPGAYIRKYAGRLPHLHIKDRAPAPDDAQCPFAEIGHGILDWDDIFESAEKSGVEWLIVEQDRCVRPPIESARLSFEYLKSRGMV
ncbi:MAG: sugar phosphate isomerase/epimerase [Candidatus Poribacteria bacterium]|nr:sugar phosphate isomerase/epimerase [Candidatus Poribacteria bacterium]